MENKLVSWNGIAEIYSKTEFFYSYSCSVNYFFSLRKSVANYLFFLRALTIVCTQQTKTVLLFIEFIVDTVEVNESIL